MSHRLAVDEYHHLWIIALIGCPIEEHKGDVPAARLGPVDRPDAGHLAVDPLAMDVRVVQITVTQKVKKDEGLSPLPRITLPSLLIADHPMIPPILSAIALITGTVTVFPSCL